MRRKFIERDERQLPFKQARDLLPKVFGKIKRAQGENPQEIFAAWRAVVGPKLAPLAKAVSFKEGRLLVIVSNPSVNHILTMQSHIRLLSAMRNALPSVRIETIVFRMGTA